VNKNPFALRDNFAQIAKLQFKEISRKFLLERISLDWTQKTTPAGTLPVR
jgi:hypothetical protein